MTPDHNVLAKIFSQKRDDLRRLNPHIEDVKFKALAQAPTRGFRTALTHTNHRPALIAEVKKASPIKGTIRENFDPRQIAIDYEQAGADCLSVLTDVEFFQGSPENLAICRDATRLPVLRKDFTAGPYHVYEARALGADAILLIVNALTLSELVEYRQLAESLGMDSLIEVHNQNEAAIALESGANLIGVNNRDLSTFAVSLETSESLLPQLSGKAILVSESGIQSRLDVDRVVRAGADAVLIGTAFCGSPDILESVTRIMPW